MLQCLQFSCTGFKKNKQNKWAGRDSLRLLLAPALGLTPGVQVTVPNTWLKKKVEIQHKYVFHWEKQRENEKKKPLYTVECRCLDN